MQTFAVSDVAASTSMLPAVTLEASMAARSLGRVEACASNLPTLVQERSMEFIERNRASPIFSAIQPTANAFVNAVHTSFDLHLPLVLSPDDVWLCLAQGLGLHINLDAERWRGRFVRHEGKKQLLIRRDAFVRGSRDNDWQSVFAELSDKIAEHIGKKRDLIVASFSTTGAIERAASEVVLLGAMQQYFGYVVETLCGIPQMTLLGTVDDWKAIRRRAEVFTEFDLEEWVGTLLPVLDQFVAAAEGKADRAFWRSFYKLDGGSGGPYVTGWLNVLFPYLEVVRAEHRYTVRNGYVTRWDKGPLPRAEIPDEDIDRLFTDQGEDVTTDEQPGEPWFLRDRPTLDNFPVGLARAPFTWEYLGTKLPMEFLGGFVGVSQEPETRAVRPAIGWAIQEGR